MSVKNEQSDAKEQRDLVASFRKLLTSRKYAEADLFLKTELNGQLRDLRERAAYCSIGYAYMQTLCGTNLREARDLTKKFDYLGFDVFYDYFMGRLEHANRKLNKSRRR